MRIEITIRALFDAPRDVDVETEWRGKGQSNRIGLSQADCRDRPRRVEHASITGSHGCGKQAQAEHLRKKLLDRFGSMAKTVFLRQVHFSGSE